METYIQISNCYFYFYFYPLITKKLNVNLLKIINYLLTVKKDINIGDL